MLNCRKLNNLSIELLLIHFYFCHQQKMKKLLAILFALSMLLQAIPVVHFFSAQPETFYIALDEEKPGEKTKELKEEKAEEKSLLFGRTNITASLFLSTSFLQFNLLIPPCPHIEMPVLPPNFC